MEEFGQIIGAIFLVFCFFAIKNHNKAKKEEEKAIYGDKYEIIVKNRRKKQATTGLIIVGLFIKTINSIMKKK